MCVVVCDVFVVYFRCVPFVLCCVVLRVFVCVAAIVVALSCRVGPGCLMLLWFALAWFVCCGVDWWVLLCVVLCCSVCVGLVWFGVCCLVACVVGCCCVVL